MKAVVQRVKQAWVKVEGAEVGRIGPGMLVLVCAEVDDTEAQAVKLLDKLLKLRMFADEAGRMNRSVQDLDGAGLRGGLLIVSQFTLAADVWAGNRPSLSGAAPPDQARALYERLMTLAKERHEPVAQGIFGADMQVGLVNDGPVTFVVQTP